MSLDFRKPVEKPLKVVPLIHGLEFPGVSPQVEDAALLDYSLQHHFSSGDPVRAVACHTAQQVSQAQTPDGIPQKPCGSHWNGLEGCRHEGDAGASPRHG